MEPITFLKSDMINPLPPLVDGQTMALDVSTESPGVPGAESFGSVIGGLIQGTQSTLDQSDQTVAALTQGKLSNPSDAMIQLEKSSLSLQFVVQVRNKAIDAYNEVMHMQI